MRISLIANNVVPPEQFSVLSLQFSADPISSFNPPAEN
jgi:hypothetical protein